MRNSAKVADQAGAAGGLVQGASAADDGIAAHQRKSSLSLPLGSALNFKSKGPSAGPQSQSLVPSALWEAVVSFVRSLHSMLTLGSFAAYALVCCIAVTVPIALQSSLALASHPLHSQPVLLAAVAIVSFAAPIAIELLVDAYQRYLTWSEWTPRCLMLAAIVFPALVVISGPGDQPGDQLFRISLVLEVLVWTASCLVMLHHDSPKAFSIPWVFMIFTSLFAGTVFELSETGGSSVVVSSLSVVCLLAFSGLFTARTLRSVFFIYRKYSWRLSDMLNWVDQLDPLEYSGLILGGGALGVVYLSLGVYFLGNPHPTRGFLGFNEVQFLLYLVAFSIFLMILSLLTNRCNKYRVRVLQHDLEVKRTYVK